METLYKNIITHLIEDACDPFLRVFRDGTKELSLPAAGDPYYTVDAVLTDEEFETLKKDFPEIQVLYY